MALFPLPELLVEEQFGAAPLEALICQLTFPVGVGSPGGPVTVASKTSCPPTCGEEAASSVVEMAGVGTYCGLATTVFSWSVAPGAAPLMVIC